MDIEQLLHDLQRAVNLLYQHDYDLLVGAHKSERTCVSQIVQYCDHNQQVNIDIESHRRIDKNGSYCNKELCCLSSTKTKYIEPDIIFHIRNDISRNFIVVEVKGWWNSTKNSWEHDDKKLCGLTSTQNGTQQPFCYELGVFLMLGKKQPYYAFYQKGTQIDGKSPEKLFSERTKL